MYDAALKRGRNFEALQRLPAAEIHVVCTYKSILSGY